MQAVDLRRHLPKAALPVARRALDAWHRVTFHRTATARWRALPDFLLIGAQKAGTTSFYHDLAAHPDILPARAKEVHYFDRDAPAGRPERWYRAQFPLARRLKGGRITGEATPAYLYDHQVPGRAAAMVPDAKLLILLRDPVARAVSAARALQRSADLPASMDDVLLEAADVFEAADFDELWQRPGKSRQQMLFGLLARGCYARQLRHWQEHVPAEQMLVLSAERLFAKPAAVYQGATRFLGIRDWTPPRHAHHNPGQGKPQAVSPATEARIRALLQPHDEALWALLGVDEPWWPLG
ncbi:MAG: sulfotransferase domain-containing protein [Thermoplasmatota archaeon]